MVATALFLSGSGTDANAVMTAHRSGQIDPDCDIVGVVSTVEGAGGLDKAKAHGYNTVTIARKGRSLKSFQDEVAFWIHSQGIKLVFLLGCIHRVPMVQGVEFFNIHPAHTRRHGGKGMYGIEPHKSVLEDVLRDIRREQKNNGYRFFTHPTVHEVTPHYDQGMPLMTVNVEIPYSVIEEAKVNLEEAAKKLQQIVLPYEHLMLPAAVNVVMRRRRTLGIS